MKKKILSLLIFALSVFFVLPIWAQTSLIGQVLDSATKEPIPYVNIGVLNKNIGTVSDDEDYFQFEVNAQQNGKDTLRFSMIGFESKTYILSDYLKQNPLEIYLSEETTALEEVILTSARREFQIKKKIGRAHV